MAQVSLKSVLFSCGNFSHLSLDECAKIHLREAKAESFCFEMRVKNKTFHFVVDMDGDTAHLRHIGGSFAWCWRWIEIAVALAACRAGLKKISVVADKAFMRYALKRLGGWYCTDEKQNLFCKVIK